MTLKSHAKFEEKLTCGMENDMRNFANFYQNTWKCQNWYFKIDIRNLMNFDPRTQRSQKCTLSWAAFDQIIYMFELKKYRGVMFNCTQGWYKIWRKTDLCFQKCTWGIWQIFTRALESLQIGTLMTYFCLKVQMYEFKNCRGVMCHGNDKWCKICRGTDLPVENWHEEFDKFWPEHSKTS